MALSTIRIEDIRGHVLHVFDRESRPQIVKQARQALRAGNAVRWEDGTREWWVLRERVDTSKAGSEQYEWDKAGEKVRADLVKYVQKRGCKAVATVTSTKRFVGLE
jgi:hypothetical protein